MVGYVLRRFVYAGAAQAGRGVSRCIRAPDGVETSGRQRATRTRVQPNGLMRLVFAPNIGGTCARQQWVRGETFLSVEGWSSALYTSPDTNSMKAFVNTEYGSADVLQLKEVATPTPKDDDVLIRIHAVSIRVVFPDVCQSDVR
jgi:hypothetical protein